MGEPSGFSGGIYDKNESQTNNMAKKNTMTPRQSTPVNSPYSSRRKNKKSPWWKHYDEVDDPNYVKCKYCGSMIGCATKNGTSGLKNHIGRCKKFSENDSAPSEQKFDQEAARKALVTWIIVAELPFSIVESESFLKLCANDCAPSEWKFVARKALATLIIVEDLRFSIVESESFVNFIKSLNPAFEPPSRKDVVRECHMLFRSERDKLKDIFGKLSSRVSLTADAWTCGHGFCYMRLTARFIDDDWVLHKNIISFTAIDDYSGESIGTYIKESLDKWGIQNLMSVTLENADSNDLATDYLKKKLNDSGKNIILNGKYLHIRCFSHMLNSFVKDGLKELNDSLSKVRFVLRYVWGTADRLQKLKACVEEAGLGSDGLVYLDDPGRWDSTYLMLQSALKYKNAYKLLVKGFSSTLLEDIKECGDDVPTDEDWTKLSSFLPILEVCCDATKMLFHSRSLTCNDYLPNVFATGLAISKICNIEDEGCRKMAEKLKLKYDQYWGDADDINHLLFVALILDPRRKMKYVHWLVSSNFEDSKAENMILPVKALITELFEEYNTPIHEATSSSSTSPVKGTSSNEKVLNFSTMLTLKFEKEMGSLGKSKTELDKYLEDPCEFDVTGFSVLNWWKVHQKKYPILAKMARDVLAISMSTVYANSAFLTNGPVLDPYRTEMSFELIELLVCTKEWIHTTEEIPAKDEVVYTLDQLLKDPEGADED